MALVLEKIVEEFLRVTGVGAVLSVQPEVVALTAHVAAVSQEGRRVLSGWTGKTEERRTRS